MKYTRKRISTSSHFSLQKIQGYFKRSWKRNIIFVWLESLVFQGVSKQVILSKATDVLPFKIFKWNVITSSLIKKQLDAVPPPPKKRRQKPKRKQNKIQPLSNLRYVWIAYRFCCDKRCENEQRNITDMKMLSTTIALYFNKRS